MQTKTGSFFLRLFLGSLPVLEVEVSNRLSHRILATQGRILKSSDSDFMHVWE